MYSHPPPPYYHQYPPKYRKRSCASRCCRCMCCCCCFLSILLLLVLAAIFVTYSLYEPKLPAYSIQSLKVKTFNVQPDDHTLKTDFELSVLAENPNKHLGLIYGDKNSVVVDFNDVKICSGTFPGFRQGAENTTVIKFGLKGNTAMDAGLQRAYNESQIRHWIPLVVKIRVPVNVLIGESPLREVRAIVNCSLVVDSLAPNSTDVKILSKEVHVRFEL